MGKLKYDKDILDYVEDKNSFGKIVIRCLKFAGYTVGLVLIYYLIYSLVFSSEEDRRLMSDSRLISEEYGAMARQADLLEGVIADLGVKDANIYMELFNSAYPIIDFSDSSALYDAGTIYTKPVMQREAYKIALLGAGMDNLESLLKDVTDSISVLAELSGKVPSILPIANFPLGNIGASVGRKMHPFYKELVYHDGLDLVAPTGEDVIATADGVVESVARAQMLEGNRVVISHERGYETVYAHLSGILVRKGQKVKKGTVIGRVGNSGTSFAPHLHYKVSQDGRILDPLTFLNGEMDTDSFGELILYALNSGQSLD